MRSLAAIIGLFLCLFWGACVLELPQPHASESAEQVSKKAELGDWRRTDSGWERYSSWGMSSTDNENGFPAYVDVRSVHPGLLASFVALASLGALTLIDERPKQVE